MSQLLTLHHHPLAQTLPPTLKPLRLHHRPLATTPPSTEKLRTLLTSATGTQLSFGSALGFATGYAAKRITQTLLLLVGLQVVAVQLMARRGWVSVDWNAVSKDVAPHVRHERVDLFLEMVRFRLPFASAFGVGCFAGFRWS